MLQLRHRWFWLVSGWVFVVAIVVASVYPAVLLAALNVSWGDKALHAVTYFLLMIWFAGLYTRRHQVTVAILVPALGVVLAMIQWPLPYRFFEPGDLIADAVGVLVGLILSLWLLAGWCQRIESRLRYHA